MNSLKKKKLKNHILLRGIDHSVHLLLNLRKHKFKRFLAHFREFSKKNKNKKLLSKRIIINEFNNIKKIENAIFRAIKLTKSSEFCPQSWS